MIIDLAGDLPSLYFPMGMYGGQVDGCSQNTSVLPIAISINPEKQYISDASLVSFYRSLANSCSMSGRTSAFTLCLVTSNALIIFFVVLSVLPLYR